MKVLILSTTDTFGGAGRAAYRLHKSLLDRKVDSHMLVQKKYSDDFTVQAYPKTILQANLAKLRPIIDVIPTKFYKNRSKTLFSPSWLSFNNIVNQINSINPDIVHLHWINGGMMKIEELLKINAPIVWTLHDNWPFTGGCHIMWDCNRYKENCGFCPRLGSNKENDLSRIVFDRKQRTFSKLPNMVIVSVSKWLETCSKESKLFENQRIECLPNPINTNVFKPINKFEARNLWNLPHDKKLVLFGAMSATNDINKGFKELIKTLSALDDKDIELVIFGSSESKEGYPFNIKAHYLGHLTDDVSLVTIYNAADVMVIPSLQEAFGQTASESMACGTPVVAFGHTGLLDIIEHKKTGYLAKSFDTMDLANGIQWILNSSNYDELSTHGRNKILQEFDSCVISKKHIELYTSILESKVNLIMRE